MGISFLRHPFKVEHQAFTLVRRSDRTDSWAFRAYAFGSLVLVLVPQLDHGFAFARRDKIVQNNDSWGRGLVEGDTDFGRICFRSRQEVNDKRGNVRCVQFLPFNVCQGAIPWCASYDAIKHLV